MGTPKNSECFSHSFGIWLGRARIILDVKAAASADAIAFHEGRGAGCLKAGRWLVHERLSDNLGMAKGCPKDTCVMAVERLKDWMPFQPAGDPSQLAGEPS